jgi:hypothetical protein
VGFAVVLLTAEDKGNLKGELRQLRAGRNVLLELGYFIGKTISQELAYAVHHFSSCPVLVAHEMTASVVAVFALWSLWADAKRLSTNPQGTQSSPRSGSGGDFEGCGRGGWKPFGIVAL